MAFAFVRRTANRTGFSTPDKNHLHHRLLRLGHGHRRSVLILWAWTVLLSGFILFPLYISSVNAIIPFGALALGVVLYTLFHPSLRRSGVAPAPTDEVPAPTDEVSAPTDEVSAPTDEVSAPTVNTPTLTVGVPAPASGPVGSTGPGGEM
jgi:UDP-GlcNAc:undecaprenyl-phosphate GlcNAc-1-phosphate transferase